MRFLLFVCLAALLSASFAGADSYDDYRIWAPDSRMRPVDMNLSLGQLANYLAGRGAEISLLALNGGILEMRVEDPRMNLNESLIHTYVFKLDPHNKTALCAHFLLNGQEVQGRDFQLNTSFLFRIISGQRHKLSSEYPFKVLDGVSGAPLPGGDFYYPRPAEGEICGRVLINIPLNNAMSFILLEGADESRPYFYLKDQCAARSAAICAKPLQKISGNNKLRDLGVMLDELSLIHQCRPLHEKN